MRSSGKNKNVKLSRKQFREDKKKLVTSSNSFFKELGLRTLAVGIWDFIKSNIT